MATQADFDKLGNWALMFNDDANIDRHKCHRVVPMEVLSLGFSRTGTLSMQEALKILGYPCYHYAEIFANVQDADMWCEALDYKFKGKGSFDYRKEFDRLLGHCGAVTDSPAVLFWKELAEAYPDAKIVLVERDEDKWYKSIEGLIDGVLNPFGQYVLRQTDPTWCGRILKCGAGWIEAFFGSTNPTQAKKNARQAYRAHYANIRATIPKERILEFDLSTGWEPLCKFLGKPVPEQPFPKRNEAASLGQAFDAFLGKAFKHTLRNAALVVGVGASVGAVVCRYM